jgi:hypothetical protein
MHAGWLAEVHVDKHVYIHVDGLAGAGSCLVLGDGLPDCLNMLLTPWSLAVLCVSVVRACRAISRSLLS